MGVAALTSDLLLGSQLRAAGQRVGTAVVIAASRESLSTSIETSPPRLIVLDLSHRGLDPQQLVAQLKSVAPEASIVAFGPHVHRERLAAATAAGCHLVKSRGAFIAEMDAILERFTAGS